MAAVFIEHPSNLTFRFNKTMKTNVVSGRQ
jgi:hypothetical protein